ncbi:MAG TPA: thioesterase family protein [Polyangiaceae bacterium]|nr:thioesterase family protein [Polyangiaceae bacterium]
MSSDIVTPWYRHRLEVAESDIDELGHASNICYVRWLQDAAVAHSTAVGLGFEGYVRLGGVFVVRRQELDYLRPALRGEALEVRTRVVSVMAAKCHRQTEIVRAADDTPLARAMTTWGFVDVTQGRPMRIPDEVYVAFGFEPRKRRSGSE